jgi:lipopolysaccharide export system permease protein
MTVIQSYLFNRTLGPLLAILGGLTLVGLVTSGIGQLSLLLDTSQSLVTFARVTLLSVPLLVGILIPVALFFAVISALNRMHGDSEIVPAWAAGMDRWTIASPIIRLATVCALVTLAINAWIQPASYRQMRQEVYQIRSEAGLRLFRPGSFRNPTEGVSVFVRGENRAGDLVGLMMEDARDPLRPVIYTAATARVATAGDRTALVMRDGAIQRQRSDGTIETLEFTSYDFDITLLLDKPPDLLLKSSDRFLTELFQPDLTHPWDRANKDMLIAEGHARLASPLLNFAMAALALAAVLGGSFSRQGYGRRIAIASAAAIVLRLVSLALTGAAEAAPAVNILQYLLPIGATWAAWRFYAERGDPRIAFRRPAPMLREARA